MAMTSAVTAGRRIVLQPLHRHLPTILIKRINYPLCRNISFLTGTQPPTLSSVVLSPANTIHDMDAIFHHSTTNMTLRHFSSEEGFFSRMRGKLAERTERKKAEQMTEQLEKMANYEEFNIGCFASDLERSMSDWKTKIPGMGRTAQVKAMKQAFKVINSVMEQLGKDATALELSELRRKDKLKIALKGDFTVEDLNSLIAQFNNMQVMFKVLRYRKLNNKSIPKDDQQMRLAVQEDALKVLSKKEKKDLKMAQTSTGAKGMRS